MEEVTGERVLVRSNGPECDLSGTGFRLSKTLRRFLVKLGHNSWLEPRDENFLSALVC